jgi:steroid 5-alpha reductase family enzyme
MTAFAAAACGAALIANLIAALIWAVTAWLLARRLGRVNIIDTLWGPGFGLIAVVTVVTALLTGTGNGVRQIVLTVLVLAWGTRLGWHVGRRGAGQGEDPRYAELLRKHGGPTARAAWRFVYLPQLVTLYVVSLPVQIGMFTGPPVGPLGWLGAAVAVTGIAFETIGDAQMNRFKADPANKGRLIDVGLWRCTRHPNYFGDACLWTGIYLIAAEHWPGMLTIVSPVLMTYLLAFGTGKRLLERSMANRPGYADYMRRTSGFIPLPPRKPRKHVTTRQVS